MSDLFEFAQQRPKASPSQPAVTQSPAAQPPATHNQPEFTVSEFSRLLKNTVEQAYSYVRIRGEISGFKRAASGHLYFSIKDEDAVLSAICWRGVASQLSVEPEEGLEVIVTGKITTYPGRSNYQIVVQKLELAGQGALMALLEKRKKMLAAEGLFDAEHKKPLPFFPKHIGIITSPTGAVIRDILHRLRERCGVHVQLWPAAVQGNDAVGQIVTAIDGFNQLAQKPDLLIVARGGGSLEDLWAFNEEAIIRAVFNSDIPIISAVGHETDTTLIDFVSDKRAPTPTAAAEFAVPVKSELIATIHDLNQRLFHSTQRLLDRQKTELKGLTRSMKSPKQVLDTMTQRLDDWHERLHTTLHHYQSRLSDRLRRLSPIAPAQLITHIDRRLQDASTRLPQGYNATLQRNQQLLKTQSQLLESYHYKKVLERGFTLVKTPEGKLITSQTDLNINNSLTIEWHDGSHTARIE